MLRSLVACFKRMFMLCANLQYSVMYCHVNTWEVQMLGWPEVLDAHYSQYGQLMGSQAPWTPHREIHAWHATFLLAIQVQLLPRLCKATL